MRILGVFETDVFIVQKCLFAIYSKIKKTTLWSASGGNTPKKKMFDDPLVTNRALLGYEKSLFGQVAILEFFRRGDPMNLVQN